MQIITFLFANEKDKNVVVCSFYTQKKLFIIVKNIFYTQVCTQNIIKIVIFVRGSLYVSVLAVPRKWFGSADCDIIYTLHISI